jgi:predicted helicase
MTLDQYLSSISTAYKDGIASELYEGEIPNLTEEIINQIAHKTGLHFILTKDPEGNVCMANNNEVRPEFRQNFTPIDILDYAYAILHSSNYHSTDKKFLKMNFPYPKNAETFWKLAEIGSQIKQIHLLENLKTEDSITYQRKITLALSQTNQFIKKIDEIKLK